ncbi:MAG: hypothetical protein HYR49_00060 [Gammaproteobacteria bacterium]|nr:hypothetical protein [Gammaproteobacteria bacterium]
MLPEVAQFYRVSLDELLGMKNGAGKRGPTPKPQRHLERIQELPKPKQRFVLEMLETVLNQAGR